MKLSSFSLCRALCSASAVLLLGSVQVTAVLVAEPHLRHHANSEYAEESRNHDILLDVNEYSFQDFLSDYGCVYHDDSEYAQRQAIFYENLNTIVEHNSKATKKRGGYVMGVNEWADRRAEELHMGYDKYQSSSLQTAGGGGDSAIEVSRRLAAEEDEAELIEKLSIHFEHVDDLPKHVDWRTKGVTTPVKSQGMCGSCWAFASTSVLESHIALQTGTLFELSPQELVSCAPNTRHCGGNGGCAGATAELAFDLVRDSGVVQEWDFGYQDARGGVFNCTLAEHTFTRDGKEYFHGSVAGIADYAVLPSNNYTVLMNTVAKLGPVTVSVACLPWHLYQSGVFYAPLDGGGKATDLDHLVVLEGYGTDEETGEEYWLVRNSWGPKWGEKGYIRLKRVGDQDCGVDETPADGTACTLDPDGNEIVPEPQTICGNSGILFDTAIPLGGYLL